MIQKKIFYLLLIIFFMSGCQDSSKTVIDFTNNILISLKIKNTLNHKTSTESSNELQNSEDPLNSSNHRKINGEFIREIFKVVLDRPVRSEDEFMKYMNILDQGAHYEGIYNGIIYSSEYKQKEVGVAPVPALKTYTEIMTQLLIDQKYDPLKIPKPERPDVPSLNENIDPPQPTEAERNAIYIQAEREGITKSTYFLKRRLGEEVLKTIDLKKEYKEKFATWYGRFTTTLNKRNIDFGLEQRNRKDEYYHYKWALDAEEDRLKWECINRLHRIINESSK